MALQTFGPISLNDIHIEAGGISVSGTQASINDTDIRGLIGKGSGVQMAFNEWWGASASVVVDTQTVTVGSVVNYEYNTARYGYSSLFYMGSISDGTSNIYPGENIMDVSTNYYGGINSTDVIFRVTNVQPNSGWETINIAGTIFTRASANFEVNQTTFTTWSWRSAGQNHVLGTTVGAVKTVTWENII